MDDYPQSGLGRALTWVYMRAKTLILAHPGFRFVALVLELLMSLGMAINAALVYLRRSVLIRTMRTTGNSSGLHISWIWPFRSSPIATRRQAPFA